MDAGKLPPAVYPLDDEDELVANDLPTVKSPTSDALVSELNGNLSIILQLGSPPDEYPFSDDD